VRILEWTHTDLVEAVVAPTVRRTPTVPTAATMISDRRGRPVRRAMACIIFEVHAMKIPAATTHIDLEPGIQIRETVTTDLTTLPESPNVHCCDSITKLKILHS
jgi:hypothetical protein